MEDHKSTSQIVTWHLCWNWWPLKSFTGMKLHDSIAIKCKGKSHNLLGRALPGILSTASNNVFNTRKDLLALEMERPRGRFSRGFILVFNNVTKLWFPPSSPFCLLQFSYILKLPPLVDSKWWPASFFIHSQKRKKICPRIPGEWSWDSFWLDGLRSHVHHFWSNHCGQKMKHSDWLSRS